MDNYNYNYRPDNLFLANSIPNINQDYYNNISNSYQLYGLNEYEGENLLDYHENNYPQTLFYRNNVNSLIFEEGVGFSIPYAKNIKKTIKNSPKNKIVSKVPKDTNKIPKDSEKAKKNYDTINKYQFKPNQNNYNNITTINNNNYNKINSINIIFDANNIYNNEYLHYNDINNLNDINEISDINIIDGSMNQKNQKININADDNNNNSEKQPKDNYKNYSDALSQINFKLCKSNNNLIRLKKNEKEKQYQDKSFTISNKREYKMNSPKNNEHIKKQNTNTYRNSYLKNDTHSIDKKNKNNNYSNKYNNNKNNIRKGNRKSEESRANCKLKKNSIKKIEKIKNDKYSIKNDNNLNDYQKKNYTPCFTSKKNINKKLLKYDNDTKRTEKSKNTKTLKQTKSYVNKKKYNFLQRRNTYNQSDLKTNHSFNISFGNNSKDNIESNFASLISEKKKRILSSIKQIDSVIINDENDKGKDKDKKISKPKRNEVFNKIKRIKVKNINKNRVKNNNNNTVTFDENIKIDKIKENIEMINKMSNKRLYSPQLSYKNLIFNRNKEIIEQEKSRKNISKKKKYNVTRNITYNKSFSTKKNQLFKKKTNLSTAKTFTSQNSFKDPNNKFKSLNYLEDFNNKNKKLKNEYSNDILKKENNEKQYINPLIAKRISLNKSDGNVLKLNKNNLKEYSKKIKESHSIKKKLYRLENNDTASIFTSKKTNKNNKRESITSSNQTSTRRTQKKSNNLTLRNSSNKKSNKNIFNYKDYLNQKTARITKKKLVYSKQKDNKEKEDISNKKKNLYSFNKKTQKKNTLIRYNTFSDDKKEIHNSNFRGFSASKKLEEIKKKYQFRPKTKEKKNNVKERNINYIEESKLFAKLFSSASLIDDSYEENKKHLFISENFDKINRGKKLINLTENKDNNGTHLDIDMSDKSFILDLNNVIPINENDFIGTVNKTFSQKNNDKGEKEINKIKLSSLNENIENENNKVDENKDNKVKAI